VHQASSAGTTKLRYDPDFRRYFAARALSLSGTVVTVIALPVLVYRISGSAALTATVAALEAVPYLLLVAFGVPAVAVFFDGANFGALPVLVGTDRIAEANFIVWSFATGVEIVLPSVVGLSLAVTHPATLLGFDALSFIASVALLRMIARPLQDPARPLQRGLGSVLADIGVGLRFLTDHAGVRTMTIVGAIQSMAGGGFVALMVVWFDRVLDIGTQGWRFGLTWSSWSVGAWRRRCCCPGCCGGPRRLGSRWPPSRSRPGQHGGPHAGVGCRLDRGSCPRRTRRLRGRGPTRDGADDHGQSGGRGRRLDVSAAYGDRLGSPDQ